MIKVFGFIVCFLFYISLISCKKEPVSFTISTYEAGDSFERKGKDITGASIFIDGKNTGVLTPGKVFLTEGSHTLMITHPDYEDFTNDFGLTVYDYMKGNYSFSYQMESKYRWLYDRDIEIFSSWPYSTTSTPEYLKASLEALDLIYVTSDYNGLLMKNKREEKLYKRKTREGKTEYSIYRTSINYESKYEIVLLGSFIVNGKHFNAKIREKNEYMNLY